MRGRSDTLIAFSTAPGETAADDGLYASVLADELRRPGSESVGLFDRVQKVVARRTERRQIPQFTSSLVETVQFIGAAVAPVTPSAQTDPADEDARDWASAFRAGTRAAFAGYLARRPAGLFAAEAQRRIAAFDQPATQIAAVPQVTPAIQAATRQDPYARWGLTEREFGLLDRNAILQRVVAGTRLPDVIAAAASGDMVAQTLRGLKHLAGVAGPQDFAQAIRWLKMAADQGEPSAMTFIGMLYIDGKAVPQNYAEAMRWFRKAAALGQPSAMTYIGHCFSNGLGVRQDYAEAMHWFLKAADLGAPLATNAIGVLYYRGQGVALDYAEALRWYRRAADLGEPGAMYNVGFAYSNGQGVPVDYAEARRWFEKSAAQGEEEAKRALQYLTSKGH
jgi:TPR repeat protein